MAFIVHRTVRPAEKFCWAYSNVLFIFLQGFHITIANSTCDAICHFRDEKGPGAEISDAIVSGIVTGDAPVSYWPIFFRVPSNSPRRLCESKLDPVYFSFLNCRICWTYQTSAQTAWHDLWTQCPQRAVTRPEGGRMGQSCAGGMHFVCWTAVIVI